MNDLANGAVLAHGDPTALPQDGTCRIDVLIDDALVVAELLAYPAGTERDRYVLTALRIGVLALKQAQGRLDADVIRGEGDRLFATLERLLRAQVGASDSELARTLAAHVGEQSALMKILRPTDTGGILHSLTQAMDKALETQRDAILSEFSLDQDDSALARLKKSVDQAIEKSSTDDAEFRTNVLASLAAMQARKDESLKSTRHGLAFEQAVVAILSADGQAAGDIVEHTAGTTGLIKNCKVGDVVITLGREHVAAGSRIVVEAKEDASYNLGDALTESEQARKNRQAEVGVFVFSRRTAGSQLAPLARYGNDIVLVWDCEDAASDVILNAGISLSRAMCVSAGAEREEIDIDLERMQRAMLDVEKQVQGLEDIRKNAQSIRSCADKIEDRARLVSENIERATRILNEEAEGIRSVLTVES